MSPRPYRLGQRQAATELTIARILMRSGLFDSVDHQTSPRIKFFDDQQVTLL